jgi:hypothetical protein
MNMIRFSRHRQRRARHIAYSQFWRIIRNGFAVALIALILGSAIGLGIYALAASGHNSTIDDKRDFASALYSYGSGASDTSESMQATRKEAANTLLAADILAASRGADDVFALTDTQRQQAQQVADSGDPIEVSGNHWAIGTYLKTVFLWPGLPIIYVMFGLVMLIGYAIRLDRDAYLADLPWKKFWPKFHTLMFGPIGWIVMYVSYRYVRNAPIPELVQAQPVRRVNAPNLLDGHADYDDYDDEWPLPAQLEPSPTPITVKASLSYASQPKVARAHYQALRLGMAKERLKARLQRTVDQIVTQNDTLRAYADGIQKLQQSINAAKADQKLIELSLETMDNGVDARIASEEFDRMMKLPGVLAIQVINDNIRLIVRANILYQGALYDVGDFRMDLGPESSTFYAYCVRNAKRSEWGFHHPVYAMTDGNFCFAARQDLLNEHLRKGQYLEAASLAIECLNSYNDEDARHIPSAFYRMEK